MFCPKCGTEYQNGITTCVDCEVGLVTQRPIEDKPEYINFVTVYETGNPAIISFAKSILDSENIRFNMKGEGVQDLFGGGRIGTGFNPIVGPVQIQVDEQKATLANKLLSELNETEAYGLDHEFEDDAEIADSVTAPRTTVRPFNLFSIGLLIGVLITAAGFYYHSYKRDNRSGVVRYDQNNDSMPDLFYKYENGKLLQIDQDRNFDDKIDSWTFYENGLPKRGESDDNFDGQIETEFFYENGLIDRVEIDTNLNLEPEIIEYYTNDVLDEKIWINEELKTEWKEVKYVGGIKRIERIDKDYDGKFDVENLYNTSGRIIKSEQVKNK